MTGYGSKAGPKEMGLCLARSVPNSIPPSPFAPLFRAGDYSEIACPGFLHGSICFSSHSIQFLCARHNAQKQNRTQRRGDTHSPFTQGTRDQGERQASCEITAPIRGSLRQEPRGHENKQSEQKALNQQEGTAWWVSGQDLPRTKCFLERGLQGEVFVVLFCFGKSAWD